MEFRLDSPCSITDLAKALGTTRSRLCRAFAEDLGTSPAAFWRENRLEAARELLRGRRRTITEIAYDVGFCDTAHFLPDLQGAVGCHAPGLSRQRRLARIRRRSR